MLYVIYLKKKNVFLNPNEYKQRIHFNYYYYYFGNKRYRNSRVLNVKMNHQGGYVLNGNFFLNLKILSLTISILFGSSKIKLIKSFSYIKY